MPLQGGMSTLIRICFSGSMLPGCFGERCNTVPRVVERHFATANPGKWIVHMLGVCMCCRLNIQNIYSQEKNGLTLLAFGPGLTMQVSRAPAPSWAALESSISCTKKSVISDTYFFYFDFTPVCSSRGSSTWEHVFPLLLATGCREVFCYDL